MTTWKKEIIKALEELGGEASRKELQDRIRSNTSKNIPPSFIQTIQHELQIFSSDSTYFGEKEDIFYSVEGVGSGIWGLRNYEPNVSNMDITQDDISYPEGKTIFRKHIRRERNNKLIFTAKKQFKEKHGKLYCQICNFNFTEKYGHLGNDFIEAHHLKAVSEMIDGDKTKIEDLIMVCSNCHSMIHRYKNNMKNIEDLKKIIIENSK